MDTINTAGLGEILWDMLPNGKILGGAPANFAFHLNSLGIKSLPISSIGKDELGEEIISSLIKKSLSTDLIQVTEDFDTGVVEVELDKEGKPSYTIKESVAWDNILITNELIDFAKKCEAVCFGSLAQRNEESMRTIQKFMDKVPDKCIKIFDINLRQNYYEESVINESLNFATILKLNEEELPIVGDIFGISGSNESMISQLLSKFNLSLIAFTKGGDGSLLVLPNKESFLYPVKANIIDTVGAGDAFTAGLVYGLLNNYNIAHTHSIANNLATFVCSQNGATHEINLENKKKILNN